MSNQSNWQHWITSIFRSNYGEAVKTLYDNEFVFLWEFHDDIVHNEHFYVLNGLGFVHWSSSQEVLRVSMCQESLARSEVRENRASKPPTDAAANTRAAIATSTADSNSMVSPRGRVQICGKNGCQWMNACVCEKIACSLCSKNFQNVKLRLDFFEK